MHKIHQKSPQRTKSHTRIAKCQHFPASFTHSRSRQFLHGTGRNFRRHFSTGEIRRTRRSFLYVPGSSMKMLQKTPTFNADTICFDLEDGVAFNAKPTARLNIRAFLRSQPQFSPGQEICIRVNSISSGLFEADIAWLQTIHNEMLESSQETNNKIVPDEFLSDSQHTAPKTFSSPLFHCIAVPKIDTVQEMQYVLHKIQQLDQSIGHNIRLLADDGSSLTTQKESSVEVPSNHRLQLIGMIETPLSLTNLPSMLALNVPQTLASTNPSDGRPARVYTPHKYLSGLIFGGDDYVNAAGCIRTDENTELEFPRNYLLLHAKAHGVQALDIVCKEFKDMDRFVRESQHSAIVGFTGRQLIHPSQIPDANRYYSPQQQNIDWALGVMCEYHENAAQGIGAWTYKGMMIDMPTIRLANNILKQSANCGLITQQQFDDLVVDKIDQVE